LKSQLLSVAQLGKPSERLFDLKIGGKVSFSM
jgi:hypothetical protein